MKMRTLPETIKYLQQQDPDTAITLTALRRMVKQGKIPAFHAGNKALIDVDTLGEYLFKPGEKKPVQSEIRRIVG